MSRRNVVVNKFVGPRCRIKARKSPNSIIMHQVKSQIIAVDRWKEQRRGRQRRCVCEFRERWQPQGAGNVVPKIGKSDYRRRWAYIKRTFPVLSSPPTPFFFRDCDFLIMPIRPSAKWNDDVMWPRFVAEGGFVTSCPITRNFPFGAPLLAYWSDRRTRWYWMSRLITVINAQWVWI